jgi:cytochrome c oxidase subunit 4
MEEKKSGSKQQELVQGIGVFAVLAVLTVIEYFLGVGAAPSGLLWAIALMKAGLVLWYFMHVKRAFSDEGGH